MPLGGLMLRSLTKFLFFVFLSLSFVSSPLLANEQIDAFKKMLENPNLPEKQKTQIRKALKQFQAMDKKMASKTDFKNSKEWYGHFKYTWQKKQGEMSSLYKKEKAKVRVKTEANYKVYEAAKYQINRDFRKKLLETKRFPESVKQINNFDNDANPFPGTVEEMFLNHIHAKVFEAKKKFAATDEEKMRLKITEKVMLQALSSKALSSNDINYLIKEIKRYHTENEKRHIKHFNSNRKAKKEGVSNFMKFAKGINFTTPPKDNSRFKVNQDRDYLLAMGELKCLSFSEPLIYQNFKVLDKSDLKRIKLKANTEIREMNKLIKIVITSMDLEYVYKNSKALLESVNSYKRKSVDYRVRDAYGKINKDDFSLSKERESAKAKIKKWTDDFVAKANSKKLKASSLYSKNQYWYGNLASFN